MVLEGSGGEGKLCSAEAVSNLHTVSSNEDRELLLFRSRARHLEMQADAGGNTSSFPEPPFLQQF